MKDYRDKICVALDVPILKHAEELVLLLSEFVGYFKIGFELFTSEGPTVVKSVLDNGGKVFLDLKYHDIPNTVAGGIRSAETLGCSFINLHAIGGSEMMKAAVNAFGQNEVRPKLLAVTVLTSVDEKILKEDLLLNIPLPDYVVHLAKLAKKSGVDGAIASPQEIKIIREACGKDFFILTPGVRPEWASKGDQKRVMTPKEAFENGADMVVIGRPITKADDPKKAAEKILNEIED